MRRDRNKWTPTKRNQVIFETKEDQVEALPKAPKLKSADTPNIYINRELIKKESLQEYELKQQRKVLNQKLEKDSERSPCGIKSGYGPNSGKRYHWLSRQRMAKEESVNTISTPVLKKNQMITSKETALSPGQNKYEDPRESCVTLSPERPVFTTS